MTPHLEPKDHTAAYAQAFFIANLLFIGFFYLALWVLYKTRYQQASTITQNHIKQALIASTISMSIFACINLFILLGSGYASLPALLSLEFYFMLVVPTFVIFGILAFIKAITHQDYRYPLIGRLINNKR